LLFVFTVCFGLSGPGTSTSAALHWGAIGTRRAKRQH
jgi:hypothetical protein